MFDHSSSESDFIRLKKDVLSFLGIFVIDYTGDCSFPNDLWKRLGHGVNNMGGRRWIEAVHPEDQDVAIEFVRRIEQGSSDRHIANYRVRDWAGQWHWLITTGVVQDRQSDGKPQLYVGMDTEITEMRRLQEDLDAARRLAEERAYEAESLRTAGALIVSSLDKEDAVRRVIDQLRGLVPVAHVLAYETDGRALTLIDTSDTHEPSIRFFNSEFGNQQLYDVMRRRTPEVFREPDRATAFWLAVPLVVRAEVVGVYALSRTDGVAFVGRDIRMCLSIADYLALALNNARLYEQMARLASTDQLSGLLTRRALYHHAESLYIQACESGSTLACVLVDIDHFKTINDSFGHQVGDAAIREVADALKSGLRERDLIGRYGGEEFCVVLPETEVAGAVDIAERMRGRVAAIDLGNGHAITASMGVSVVQCDADRSHGSTEATHAIDTLLSRADRALYSAKAQGRDRVIPS